MKLRNTIVMLCSLLALCVLTLWVSRTQVVKAATDQWELVNIPNPPPNSHLLGLGVEAISKSDICAVGFSGFTGTYTLHWDGTTWLNIPSPNPAAGLGYLHSVAAVSTNDVWAVGYCLTGTLTMHWNGVAWNIVHAPNGTGSSDSTNILEHVTAVASENVWAVGHYKVNNMAMTLTMRWNGNEWAIENSPNPGSGTNTLYGAAAVPGNAGVWAVGNQTDQNYPSTDHTLTMLWSNVEKLWRYIPSPDLTGVEGADLFGVAALTSSDAWAVGFSAPNNQTLTEHWDGTKWKVVASPNAPVSSANQLTSVSASVSNYAWAVGAYWNLQPPNHNLTMRWNGVSWNYVLCPNPDPELTSELLGVSIVPGTTLCSGGDT